MIHQGTRINKTRVRTIGKTPGFNRTSKKPCQRKKGLRRTLFSFSGPRLVLAAKTGFSHLFFRIIIDRKKQISITILSCKFFYY
jgi:hypothetical protein